MVETMKVIEAIGQLKIQEDRVFKAIAAMVPVAANRLSAKKINGESPEEFAKLAKSTYDSATTLINRYIAMKEAVNEFNAGTKINVEGQEMSVASAIYLKEHGIDQKRSLLSHLTTRLEDAIRKINEENGQKLNDAAERNAKQNFDGDTKSDRVEYLKFIEEYKERNQFVLIDPIDIRKKIEKLEEEISKFQASVDTAIQIANATHDITFEY